MKTLTESDYQIVSIQEAIGVPELKALKEVESNGNGHLPDGRPKILFEGHKFYQHLSQMPEVKAKAMRERPDLCHRSWTKAFYKGGALEWGRLAAAILYDREAALKSASWGAFQILGENHRACGFDTVQDFVNAMYKSERYHLEAVCNFIKAHPTMHKALIARDWATFARYYNGPAYKQNKYDVKLSQAFARHSKKKA